MAKKSIQLCWLVALGSACGLVSACGPGSDNEKHLRAPDVTFERDPESFCARLIEAARACDLLEGEGEPPCSEPRDSISRCYNECLIEASCSDLEIRFCDTNSVIADLTDSVPCFTACNAPAFSCKLGTTLDRVVSGDAGMVDAGAQDAGAQDAGVLDAGVLDAGAPGASDGDAGQEDNLIPPEYVCDSVANCDNGADEADCPTLENATECDDGSPVSRQHLCDGIADCPHESDEDPERCEGELFDCQGGYRIPMALRCDGIIHCPSEYDEVGCPPLAAWRCDGS